MFELLYDISSICITYCVVYTLLQLIVTKYSLECRKLFDLRFRVVGLSRESDVRDVHQTFSVIASAISFPFLIISPMLYTLIYVLYFRMIDIRQLNKIVLISILFQCFKTHHSRFRPHKHLWQAVLVLRLFFVVVTYTHRDMVFQTMFQLVDEICDLQNGLILLKLELGRIITDIENPSGQKFTKIILWLNDHKVKMQKFHLTMLIIVFGLSFIYIKGFCFRNISFYCYATYRIINILN